MKKGFFITLLLFFSNWAQAQNKTSLSYTLYDCKNKTICSLSDLVKGTNESNIIFFGEEHDDSIGHVLQDTIYKALIDRYKKVTLSMEMFERDNQVVVDEYVTGYITEAPLIKEGRAWKNYNDYRGPVNTAKRYQQKVIAANSPRRYVNIVSRKGLTGLKNLSKESKKYFAPLPIDTVNAPYAKKFKEIMGGHGGVNSYYAQSLWDATMAYSIYTFWKEEKDAKIFHMSGRFHSDEKLGTVYQLQGKNKKLKITTISCFPSEDYLNSDWSKYESLADFIILTDSTVPRTF